MDLQEKLENVRCHLHNIFYSIQGEGKYMGVPTLFFRFNKCNLLCDYCIGYMPGRNKPEIMGVHKSKHIMDVEVGDKLLTVDNNGSLVETNVKNIYTRDVTKYYRLKIENKPLLYVTPEHPFLVNGVWKLAKDLEVGDEIEHVSMNEKLKYWWINYNPMFSLDAIKKHVKNTDYDIIGEKVSRMIKRKKENGTYKSSIQILKENSIESYNEWKKKLSFVHKGKKNGMYGNTEVAKRTGQILKMKYANGEIESYWDKYKREDPERYKYLKSEASRRMMGENNPMKDLDVRKRNWKSHNKRPTSPEKKFIEFIDQYNLLIDYVGNGKLWVRTKGEIHNPDFIVTGQKKVVEIYDSTSPFRDDSYEERMDVFYESAGYKCFCIDLKRRSIKKQKEFFIDLLPKVNKFIHNGLRVLEKDYFDVEKKYNYKYPNGKGSESFKVKKKLKVFNFTCEPYNSYIVNGLIVHNCDTKFSECDIESVDVMVKLITDFIKSYPIQHICFTGGESLMFKDDIVFLVNFIRDNLHFNNFSVKIETNGTLDLKLDIPFTNIIYTITPKHRFPDKYINIFHVDERYRYDKRFNLIVYKFMVDIDNVVDDLNLIYEFIERFSLFDFPIYFSPINKNNNIDNILDTYSSLIKQINKYKNHDFFKNVRLDGITIQLNKLLKWQ